MAQRTDILVVGAGVAGLTTAVCLAERGLSVRLRADQPPMDTTSAVAGAIAGGPVFADPEEAAANWQPVEDTTRWHRITLEEFGALAERQETGVRIARGRMVHRSGERVPEWGRHQPGFAECAPQERAGFPVAFWMSMPVIDMRRYLEYLADRFAKAGGTMEIRHVAALEKAAADADVVVNCSGLGAVELAADRSVKPVRGQHVVVENPGIDDFLFEYFVGSDRPSRFTSYVAHPDRILLGGTADKDDWRLDPDPADTEEIRSRCATVDPRLAQARILGVEVGLRVARPHIRLEEEQVGAATVIHNYGHGGVGAGLSWGCAREVEQMVLARRRPR